MIYDNEKQKRDTEGYGWFLDEVKNDRDWAKKMAIDIIKDNSNDLEFISKVNRTSYGLMNIHDDFNN